MEDPPLTEDMLPTFLIIGAPKAGTTSLYHYLGLHPQVFVPEEKEPNFFNDNWDRGIAWYEEHFRGGAGAVAVGDCSSSYTSHPASPEVPQRAATVVPDAKLIYLVRQPVERMVSHYHWRAVAGRERRPIETALLEGDYVDVSRYAMQIEQWLKHFPQERLLVVTQEQLRRDRRPALRRVYGFLGADPEWWSSELTGEWNVSASLRLRKPGVQRLMRSRLVSRPFRSLAAPVKERLRVVTHVEPPPIDTTLSPELEAKLTELVREDVAELYRYADADFDGWGIA